VNRFRNGDLILEAQTNEEWEIAGKNKQPAWCYYNNDRANDKIFGKLYNWYALNDPRGIVSSDWALPNEMDFTELLNSIKLSVISGSELSAFFTNAFNQNGYRFSNGSFLYQFKSGFWWSVLEKNNDTSHALYIGSRDNFGISTYCKSMGFSVKYIRG